MKRPCGGCDRYRPGKSYDIKQDCRICFLYHTRPEYKRLWDGEPPLPGIIIQAANYAAAQVRHTLNGRKEVSEATKATRLALCVVCPAYRPSDGKCSACGCDMKIKASWEIGKCPKGKW